MIGRADNKNNIKLNFKVINTNIPPVVQSKIHLQTMSSNRNCINETVIAKGDSGATKHYITNNDSTILKNITNNNTVKVNLPNGDMLSSVKQGHLPIPLLSPIGKTAYVLKDLNTSLISLGQLTDEGCTIVLTKKQLQVFKNYTKILQGYRNEVDGLWDIHLNGTIPNIINQPLK